MSIEFPIRAMAHYNHWQNNNLINTADILSTEDRQRDLGAFFGSIEKTFNHLLWGDKAWLSRFGDFEPPRAKNFAESLSEGGDWVNYKVERRELDQKIIEWTQELDLSKTPNEITWFSKAIDKEVTRPTDLLIVHLFNHQTHHRGQIHAMLTRLGQNPSETDIPFLPNVESLL